MKKSIVFVYMLGCVIISCKNTPQSTIEFPIFDKQLEPKETKISKEQLGLIEGIHCDSSHIVTLDFHDGTSYSLFNITSGKRTLRFGETGHGNMEIPLGCMGSIYNGKFYAFDDEQHVIASYKMDAKASAKASTIVKYKINDAQFSQIVPVDSLQFVGMGTYKSRYQYVVFNDKNRVSGCGFDIYNKDDKELNEYHKFLSNQGYLVRHPHKKMFAGAVRYSANIDFFSVENGKINVIRSIRDRNPQLTPVNIAGMNRMIPDDKTICGFLDLCATDKYVFALYSEKTLKSDSYSSKSILVYDWNGNGIGKIIMENNVFYICANESQLFTVEKDDDGHFKIKEYMY